MDHTNPIGALYKIKYASNDPPAITSNPSSLVVSVWQPATFTVTASGTPPLSYQWYRNLVFIPGATSISYTLASAEFG